MDKTRSNTYFDIKDDNVEIRLLEPGYEDEIAYFRRGENC